MREVRRIKVGIQGMGCESECGESAWEYGEPGWKCKKKGNQGGDAGNRGGNVSITLETT